MPAILVATDAFVSLAQLQARTLDSPDIPIVAITHPLGGIDQQAIKDRAAEALESLRGMAT